MHRGRALNGGIIAAKREQTLEAVGFGSMSRVLDAGAATNMRAPTMAGAASSPLSRRRWWGET